MLVHAKLRHNSIPLAWSVSVFLCSVGTLKAAIMRATTVLFAWLISSLVSIPTSYKLVSCRPWYFSLLLHSDSSRKALIVTVEIHNCMVYFLFLPIMHMTYQVVVEADYVLSIQLISYSNPDNRLASGTCCNGSEERGACPAPCNTVIRFCVRNAGQPFSDPSCPLFMYETNNHRPRGLNPLIHGPLPVSMLQRMIYGSRM